MQEYRKETSTFKSNNGKNTIFYYVYAPKEPPKAIVQLSHGMCEYVERYEEFAEYLVSKGIAFCGNDHLGHGRTGEASKSFGYFDKDEGWRFLAKDVHSLTEIMKERYPDVPYFLFGHSMGSFVARNYLESYGNELDGVIISGTSGGESMGKMGIALANSIAKTKGELYRSKLLTKIAFGSYNKRYKDARTQSDWLSRDTQVVDKYRGDKWCRFMFSASAYKDLFTLLDHVTGEKWAQKVPKNLPIYLMSGDMDPVGNYGKGVLKVYDLLKNTKHNKAEIKLYKEGRHEMLNELNKKEVMADILDFIEKHI